VHKALADAVDDGVIVANPAERAKPPKPGRTSARELRFWEPEQLARFLDHVRGSRLEALWHLAAFTGMRRGELLGLRWGDIDFELRRLCVRRNLVSVAYRLVETTPKTHQARVIDLDDTTVTMMRAHRQAMEQQQGCVAQPWSQRPACFTMTRALTCTQITCRNNSIWPCGHREFPASDSTTYATPTQPSRCSPACPQK
jgi:integrase